MSIDQYFLSFPSPTRKSTATHFQTANPYADLVATADPEHNGRSSPSGSPFSSDSSASFVGYDEAVAAPATLSRSQSQTYSGLRMLQQEQQQHHYFIGSPEQGRFTGFSADNTPTRTNNATRSANYAPRRTAAHASIGSASHIHTMAHHFQKTPVSSLVGVPESVAVQEMAFRQGQRDSSNTLDDVSSNPFAKQFEKLWNAFYKLGKECGGQPTPVPINPTRQNFAWPVLINPYTQSLEQPNGSLDPVWTHKMIQAALNCMKELIGVTCRRDTGWDKTVADIPLPAQEALGAFPDLAQEYELLKRDAKEARAGGRPYGY